MEPGKAEMILQQVQMGMTPERWQELRQALSACVNNLIQNNFSLLIHLLYRADIEENHLRRLLSRAKDQDAALIIADELLLRQEQKLLSRQQFRQDRPDSEDERW